MRWWISVVFFIVVLSLVLLWYSSSSSSSSSTTTSTSSLLQRGGCTENSSSSSSNNNNNNNNNNKHNNNHPVCFPDLSRVQRGCLSCEALLAEYRCVPPWRNTTSCATPAPDGRCGPSVFMIGPQKSGSSSLFNFASLQKGFTPASTKEIHYYDVQSGRSPETVLWTNTSSFRQYLSNFPKTGPGVALTGDFTPAYLLCPLCAAAVRRHWPAARVVVTLRDPSDRALSHYSHDSAKFWRRPRRVDGTPLETFLHDAEMLRTHGFPQPTTTTTTTTTTNNNNNNNMLGNDSDRDGWDAHALFRWWFDDKDDAQGGHYNHLLRGVYDVQLREWRRHFPARQILALDGRHLFHHTTQPCALQLFMRFAGFPRPASDAAIAALRLPRWRDEHYPPPPPSQAAAARLFLSAFYAPHNARLYRYLGRDLHFA